MEEGGGGGRGGRGEGEMEDGSHACTLRSDLLGWAFAFERQRPKLLRALCVWGG